MQRIIFLFLFVFIAVTCGPRGAGDEHVRASDSRLDFGTVLLGWDTEGTVTIFNDSADSIPIEVELAGDAADSFRLLVDRDFLPAAQGTDLQVAFVPSRSGTSEARLDVLCADSSSLLARVALLGEGQHPLRPSLEEVSFDPVPRLGTRSEEVLLTNIGPSSLNVELSVDSNAFEVWPAVLEIEPGEEVSLMLSFAPVSSGERLARLELLARRGYEEAPVAPLLVSLKGVGFAGDIEITPCCQISLGSVIVGTTTQVIVELRNTTVFGFRANYEVSGKNFSMNPSRWDETSGEIFLEPEERTLLVVSFTPQQVGSAIGQLAIRAEGSVFDSLLTLYAEVLPFALEVAPEILEFGAVFPGTKALEELVFINWRDFAVDITSLTIVDARGEPLEGPFALDTVELPLRLPPGGGQETVVVAFSSEDLETHTAWLDWTSSDVVSSGGRVYMEARGGGPRIEILPGLLDFGSVAVGSPLRRKLTILNKGFEELEIGGVSFEGNLAFSAPDASWPVTLGPGEKRDLLIEIRPEAEGLHQGRLLVRSNDSSEPESIVLLEGEAFELPACQLAIWHENVEFGIVAPNRERRQPLLLKNQGGPEDTCIVRVLGLEPESSDAFSLAAESLEGTFLEPGEEMIVDLFFKPRAEGIFAGALHIYVSNPQESVRVVEIGGQSRIAAVLLAPEVIKFGQTQLGCASPAREVLLYNTGSADITVTDITLRVAGSDLGSFEILELPEGLQDGSGVTIEPGANLAFGVELRPMSMGEHVATVEVEMAELDAPFVLLLEGVGAIKPTRTDVFTEMLPSAVDVLFIIDDSLSMSPYQDALRDGLQDFLEMPTDRNTDYHIGVITTDSRDSHAGGVLRPADASRPRIVSRALSDPLGVLRQNMMVETSNDALSQGLGSAELFFCPTYLADPEKNAGFLRDEAHLAMVLVSDKPDESPWGLDYYLDFFRHQKDVTRPEMLTISAIVSIDELCANEGPHRRYMEIANRTHGLVASICEGDLSQTLAVLSSRIFGPATSFSLGGYPEPGTIEVRLLRGGTDPMPAQLWGYDGETNTVRFDILAAPEDGDVVEVSYEVLCFP